MKTYILFFLILFCLIGNKIQAQTSLKFLSSWSDSTLIGSNAFNNIYNEVWGLSVNGSEFAVLGSTAGTHFINVSDPEDIFQAFFVEGGTSGGQIIHRDYHDNRGFLYAVADEGVNSSLQIIDITDLPNSIHVVYDSGNLIRRTHNMFIDSTSDIMYACISAGNQLPFARLRTFDISDPINPKELQVYSSIGGFSFQQVHDAYVIRDTAYLNCGPSGFAIVDFSDKEDPDLLYALSPVDYPQSGYNHSGWLSPDGNTYVMADEDHGMDMKVFDATDKRELELIDLINAGSSSPFSIPHNQIIHDNYLYASYYYDGIQIYNMEDPLNITREFYFDTSIIDHRQSYEGAWGVYPFLPSGNILVSDMQTGLFVLKFPGNISSNENLELSVSDIHIYPNPSNGEIQVDIPEELAQEEALFILYTLAGNKVLEKKINTKSSSLELNHLESASYHYSIRSSSYSKSGKLIVLK